MLIKQNPLFKAFGFFVVATLIWSGFGNDIIKVKTAFAAELALPAVGTLVELSDSFSLPSLKGIRFDQSNPFDLEFIIDRGDSKQISVEQRSKLVRLFLGALTIPEDNLWVNLSPYEKERVINDNVAKTEIGETLLKQDYVLKQLSASLTNPDTKLGKEYWNKFSINDSRLSAKSDAFSKIWISPSKISVYDDSNVVFINNVELDVQTEADYLATTLNEMPQSDHTSNTVRDLIVPQIKKDVNTGNNFAELRQMINSVVLAQCFKKKFANSLYSFYYNSEKLDGVNVVDSALKNKVFERYVESFNIGTYKTTKKVKDPQTGRLSKRSYFSGGINANSSAVNAEEERLIRDDLPLDDGFLTAKVKLSLNDPKSQEFQQNIKVARDAAIAASKASNYESYKENFVNIVSTMDDLGLDATLFSASQEALMDVIYQNADFAERVQSELIAEVTKESSSVSVKTKPSIEFLEDLKYSAKENEPLFLADGSVIFDGRRSKRKYEMSLKRIALIERNYPDLKKLSEKNEKLRNKIPQSEASVIYGQLRRARGELKNVGDEISLSIYHLRPGLSEAIRDFKLYDGLDCEVETRKDYVTIRKTKEKLTTNSIGEQSSALSVDESFAIQEAALLALSNDDFNAFEIEYLKLYKVSIDPEISYMDRSPAIEASLDILRKAPDYVAKVIRDYEQKTQSAAVFVVTDKEIDYHPSNKDPRPNVMDFSDFGDMSKIQSWDAYLYELYQNEDAEFTESSSIRQLFLVPMIIAVASLPFVVTNVWSQNRETVETEQVRELVPFDKVVYDQKLTRYLEMASMPSLISAISYKAQSNDEPLSLSYVRQRLGEVANYLTNEYYNNKDLSQPLIDTRINEIRGVASFLYQYQYYFGGHVEGASEGLYNAAISDLFMNINNKNIVDALEILESIQIDEGTTIEEVRSLSNLSRNLKRIFKNIDENQPLDSDEREHYRVQDVYKLIDALIEEQQRTAGSAVQTIEELRAISDNLRKAATANNVDDYIKEYLKLYEIINTVKNDGPYNDEDFHKFKKYVLSEMVVLFREYPEITDKAVEAYDEIRFQRSEEIRKSLPSIKELRKKNPTIDGGIDLKGMAGMLEVESSSSAITISPEYAKIVTGLNFKFVGDMKMMPLRALLSR